MGSNLFFDISEGFFGILYLQYFWYEIHASF